MKQLLKQSVLGLLIVPFMAGAALTVLPVSSAHAADPDACNDTNINVKAGAKCARGEGTKTQLVGGDNSLVRIISNVLLFVLGAIAVIMIILGGIRYVTSNGDTAQLTSAKNTIMYAVIGLVVALMAYAIVNFITDSFVNDTTTAAETTA